MNLGSIITTALFPCLAFALMLAIGFLLVKIKKLDKKGVDTVIMLCLNVALPCMVFKCVYDSGMSWSDLTDNYVVLIGSILVFVILLLVHLLEAIVLRLKPESKWIYMLCGGFGNTGMIGVPIILGIFSGSETATKIAAFGIAIYTLPDIILAYTLAPYFSKKHLNGNVEDPYAGMSKGKRFRAKLKDIFNPIVIGVILGFIFCMAQIKLPSFLTDIVAYGYDTAVFLCALQLGALIGFAHLREVFRGGRKYVHIITKMLIMPILLFILFGLFDFGSTFGEEQGTIIRMLLALMAAQPSNLTLPAYAHMYHADESLATDLNMIGTIVAIISMPIVYVVCTLIS